MLSEVPSGLLEWRRDESAALVVEDRRRCQPVLAPERNEVAALGGEHVLDPLRLDALGQRDHVAGPGAKDVDRRPVSAARAAAGVLDDTEPRQPTRERARDAVREGPAVCEHDFDWPECQ